MVCLFLSISERADPNYCRDRITEGANINKSLVTLGIVISALGMGNSSNILLNKLLSIIVVLNGEEFCFPPVCVFGLSSPSSELSDVQ